MSCCPINRVWCDSWSWCLARMPPITSARPPNRSWQLSLSHSSSWTYQSLRGRVTATWAPIVTCRCIFFLQDLNVLYLPCLSCLFVFVFHSPISSLTRSQIVKKSEKGGSGPAAVVFGEAARWAVVQSAEEMPLPLRRHGVDCRSSGWGRTFVLPSMVIESRFRI